VTGRSSPDLQVRRGRRNDKHTVEPHSVKHQMVVSVNFRFGKTLCRAAAAFEERIDDRDDSNTAKHSQRGQVVVAAESPEADHRQL